VGQKRTYLSIDNLAKVRGWKSCDVSQVSERLYRKSAELTWRCI